MLYLDDAGIPEAAIVDGEDIVAQGQQFLVQINPENIKDVRSEM